MLIKTSILLIFLFGSFVTANAQKLFDCSHFVYSTHGISNFAKPEYPAMAKAVGVSGKVSVRVLVDENGNVVEAKVVSGHLLLRAATVKAALQTKFLPIELSGKKISCYVVLVYNFVDDLVPNKTPKNLTKIEPTSNSIGKPLKLFKPPFPSNCRCKFSKNNKVVVQFTINENGFVEEANAISGHPLLRAASVAAIRNSKFSASLVNGKPVKAYGTIVYDFVVRNRKWQTRVIKYKLKLDKNK